MKFGIFLSDASFDYKTKFSVAGIKEMISGETKQVTNASSKNPTEAEKFGIMESLKFAESNGYDNVVFICDNKKAITYIKREFFQNENLRSKFWYVQFLWLPREFMHAVDFLSKNLDSDTAKEVQSLKNENSKERYVEFCNKHLDTHINSITADKSVKEDVLSKRIDQFVRLKEGSFSSSFFKNIQSLSIKELENLVFEEIELIENDIASIEDPILKLVAQNILDSLIGY